MPRRPMTECLEPGCHELVAAGRCAAHTRERRSSYDDARGNSAERGYGHRWRKLRERILNRDPLCQAAGCDRDATDVDHIVPRSRGGTDGDNNLQGLCHECHSAKTAREDGRWKNT